MIMAKYVWIIDVDTIGAGRVGCIGPRGADVELQKLLAEGKGDVFEMYDDDKEMYYAGRIVGKYDGFEPLDDLGTPDAGCVAIKYKTGEFAKYDFL
jgi:hypothetical protein